MKHVLLMFALLISISPAIGGSKEKEFKYKLYDTLNTMSDKQWLLYVSSTSNTYFKLESVPVKGSTSLRTVVISCDRIKNIDKPYCWTEASQETQKAFSNYFRALEDCNYFIVTRKMRELRKTVLQLDDTDTNFWEKTSTFIDKATEIDKILRNIKEKLLPVNTAALNTIKNSIWKPINTLPKEFAK